jgi:hypothetical protein
VCVRTAYAGPVDVNDLYNWTNEILVWALIALRGWALFDCLTHKAAAFPAVDKLTKPAWTLMLLVGGFLGSYLSLVPPVSPVGVFSLISTVIASVYLADVRPAVKEISGGR